VISHCSARPETNERRAVGSEGEGSAKKCQNEERREGLEKERMIITLVVKLGGIWPF